MQLKSRQAGDRMSQQERWETEHIDIFGHLRVPVMRSTDPSPEREGWEPFFVTVNLAATPNHKVVSYRRVEN
jgi:hypothetical protein